MDGRHVEPAENWLRLIERLAMCSRLLRAELDACMDACALNPSQFSLLWACYAERAGVGQRELAGLLAVSPAHVSGLVEQLRRRRLLAGHRPSADRRRQLWRLTARGQDVVESVLAQLDGWARQLEHHMPADAPQVLERMLEQVSAAVASARLATAAASQKGAA
jgi:DNA-binding MarR family transcriptional regulator